MIMPAEHCEKDQPIQFRTYTCTSCCISGSSAERPDDLVTVDSMLRAQGWALWSGPSLTGTVKTWALCPACSSTATPEQSLRFKLAATSFGELFTDDDGNVIEGAVIDELAEDD